MHDYSHPKTTLPFCHEWQRVSHWEVIISFSLEKLASSSLSSSSSIEPLSASSSSEASRKEEGDGDAVKPPMRACRHVIRLTRVFTWYNSIVSVSRQASMRSSCTMTASSVTPPLKEKGAEVDGMEGAGGVVILVHGCFSRSWASLRRTDATLMAPMTVKRRASRIETEKWKMIRVIVEGKLITSHRISINIDERENEVRRKVYRVVLNEG